MKTIELTLLTLATFGFYSAFLYYQLAKDNQPEPANLWYGIGDGLNNFLFNGGVKPKKAIQEAPNNIARRLGLDN
jgi:hypothetical protein